MGADAASRALLGALQRRDASSVVLPLVSPATAARPDPVYGLKPLFWALSYGAPAEVLGGLISAHPEAAREKHPQGGWTPLHYVEGLSEASVRLLLAECGQGAAALPDGEGKLPLHWAAEHAAPVEVLQLLLEADPMAASARDAQGRLPLHLALDFGASDVAVDLLRLSAGTGPASVSRGGVPEGELLPIALLFSGGGDAAACVGGGMLSRACSLPAVQAMLKEARGILGFDLEHFCQEPPAADECTANGQAWDRADPRCSHPAAFVVSLAALELLRHERPEAASRCQAMAGFSVGEVAALTAAGVFSFADGLRLVVARAEALAGVTVQAGRRPQAAITVAGLERVAVAAACDKAKVACGDHNEVCCVAGHVFTRGFLVAGTRGAVDACATLCSDAGAIQAKPVPPCLGELHTELAEETRHQVGELVRQMMPRMGPSRCKVYLNGDARPVDGTTSREELVARLSQQVARPVLWMDSVVLLQAGVSEFYELGGTSLKAWMRHLDKDAWSRTATVLAATTG